MVETIDGLIRSGKRSYFDGVDKRAVNASRNQLPHDHLKCLQAVTEELNIICLTCNLVILGNTNRQ